MQDPIEQPRPSPETISGIETLSPTLPIAEDIARFRTEVERKILYGLIPPSEWFSTSAQALAKYPRIQQYRDVFDSAVNWTLGYRQRLDSFWNRFNPQGEQAQVDPEHAKSMYAGLFGLDPQGEIKVKKGIFTLNMILSDEDFDDLGQKNNWPRKGAIAYSGEINGIRVHISNGNVTSTTDRHELEHSKNRIFQLTYQEFPQEFLPTGEVSKGVSRLKANPYVSVQDEIIAALTSLETISKEQLTKDIRTEYKELLAQIMVNEYMPTWLREPRMEGITREVCEKRITLGLKAIFELYDMYSDAESGRNSIRMTVNVLNQFPLGSWPVVVRLLKQRHNSPHETA